jgi:alpha-tubulin suppressor-like RCC1 family protein
VVGAAGAGGNEELGATTASCRVELGGGTCRWVLGVGAWSTCAITTGSVVKCWGLNDHGQLGDGEAEHEPCALDQSMRDCSSTPVVAELEQPRKLAGGEVTNCALNARGHLYCWGLDLRNDVDLDVATRFGESQGSTALSVRLPFGVTPGDGTVWVGGLDVQGNGVFGSGAAPMANERRFQAPVTGLSDAVAFDLGWYHGCAVRAGGSVVCWGKGQSGELGDGSKMNRNELVVAAGVARAVGVAVGDGTSCALLDNGEVTCWGAGHPGGELTPTRVAGLPTARDVRAGFGHLCALHDDGTVSCWGRNGAGQVGPVVLGTTVSQPTRVEGISEAVAIGLGAQHSCALLKQGNVVCWGSNQFGQLGTGTFTSPLVPTAVKGL